MPQLRKKATGGAESYFSAPKSHIKFIRTGCRLLDCVLGGGWPLGRVSNIVGDKSTGKTLLAIEATSNFARTYPKGRIWYREAEAAFDEPYAAALGMPLDRVDFWEDNKSGKPFATVEDFYEDLAEQVGKIVDKGVPGLYVLDSLDALSDREELEREIDKGSYGTQKAKKMSELFRKLIRDVERSDIHLMIISQVRDKIGGMGFGDNTSRAGGRALDFYASLVVYLKHIGYLYRTVQKVKRPIGISIQARCKKNKISLPQRECAFDLMFGYGIDDLTASLEWLKEIGRLDVVGTTEVKVKEFLRQVESKPDAEYFDEIARIGDVVENLWREVEVGFLPTRVKYGSA